MYTVIHTHTHTHSSIKLMPYGIKEVRKLLVLGFLMDNFGGLGDHIPSYIIKTHIEK